MRMILAMLFAGTLIGPASAQQKPEVSVHHLRNVAADDAVMVMRTRHWRRIDRIVLCVQTECVGLRFAPRRSPEAWHERATLVSGDI